MGVGVRVTPEKVWFDGIVSSGYMMCRYAPFMLVVERDVSLND